MNELGKVNSVSVLAHAKIAAANLAAKASQEKGKSRSGSPASANPAPEQTVEPAGTKAAAIPSPLENMTEELAKVVDERERLIHSLDMDFGDGKLNMRKTLKTTAGKMGTANTAPFAFGAGKHGNSPTSLMGFTSFSDYLGSKMKNFNEDAWKSSGTALAHQITKDAASMKNAYGDISAHRVVFLLSGKV